jgi:hypothetical protein
MTSSLLSLRSRMTGQAKTQSIPALPTKRLHANAFRDYQSITPQDEPVCPCSDEADLGI